MPRTLPEKREANLAVSNTSSLIALKHTGLLEKLSLMVQTIIIPPSVMREPALRSERIFPWLKLSTRREVT